MAILYGIKKAVLTELDPSTGKPPSTGGKTVTFKTAEEASLEPVVSEGAEEIKRNAEQILAVVREDDLLYGYNITLKDNEFTADVAGLVAGYTVTGGDDSQTISTPMMSEGKMSKPFKLELYIANYSGDSVANYCKVTFNKCEGSFPSMNFGKEFMAPEFSIKARENTKASLPIKSISFVTTLA